jgi:ATP-dependent DNA helicase DinG
VQEKDSNKDTLADDFKEDIHSVLLATKSFFTGFDAPGETLSMVVMCKFPLPRYSVECRMMIVHWRKRGFPNWYSRLALTDLEQAFGRLIRSSGCRGILAMLDYRVVDSSTNVGRTAAIGMSAVGSPITYNMNAVGQFLDAN